MKLDLRDIDNNFVLNGYQSLELVKDIKGRIELKKICIDNIMWNIK